MPPHRRKETLKQIALERITTLFEQASNAFHTHPERSHRYVTLALRIAAKAHARIPSLYKRQYCRTCHHYLVSGINARVRTRNKKLITYCKHCKHYKRMPLRPRP